MRTLPHPPSANERQLASVYIDEFTGVTGTTLTLTHEPATTTDGVALVSLFKNGSRLSLTSAAYTISGKTITLAVALISGDVTVADYAYRNI